MKIKNYPMQIGKDLVQLELHYNPKTELFSLKNLPDDFNIFAPSWEQNRNTITSENRLRTCIIQAISEYVENKVSARKVIIFNCGASGEITQNYAEPYLENGVIKKVSQGTRKNCETMFDYKIYYEFGIGFNFFVCTEKDNAGIKSYYKHMLTNDLRETDMVETYSRISGTEIKSNNYKVIDFTPEALEFFRSLSISFKNMANQMATFFGEKDVQKQLEFINNQKLIG